MSTERCDVLIAGAGPAGTIAARHLALAGLSVVIADGLPPRACKIGEMLPGAAIRLLHELKLEAIITAGQPTQCPVGGLLVGWNGALRVANDGCNDPYGGGLRVDRASFDDALRQAARTAGVSFQRANVVSLMHSEQGWAVRLADGSELSAHWIIDATGRRARVARLLGQRRDRGPPLVALYRSGRPEKNAELNRTLIAAGPEGWIYAGRRGNGGWVFGYHTTPQQAAVLRARPEGWQDIISSTGLTALLGQVALEEAVHIHDARSAWLKLPTVGQGWLACGDAALAFDPIAGQGLFNALYTGMSAAKTIRSAHAGSVSNHYIEEMGKVASIYNTRRCSLYRQERRWCERPFWRTHSAAF